jgi:L-lysine 6-oxidase
MRFEIHPSIGVARVGNSPGQFYLAPDEIGASPDECEPDGTPIVKDGLAAPVQQFKDANGRVRRQAARFRVLAFTENGLDDPGYQVQVGKEVTKLEWTVHVANKKAAWYNFSELAGDLMLGVENSYAAQKVPLRNAETTAGERQKLIVDPGPHTLSRPGDRAEFSKTTIPKNYPFGSFPGPVQQGFEINTLGEAMIDQSGALVVLGGIGAAGGNTSISSFAGADSWNDDISDGPVTCVVTLSSGQTLTLNAWLIVGSPKFAPELVNVVSLDDIAFDVAVRYQSLVPGMFSREKWTTTAGWNHDYIASYERDIAPIFKRLAGYQWVANVPSMTVFSAPPFDARNNSPDLLKARETFFSYFRKPGSTEIASDGQENQLLSAGLHGIPMMPLNSGNNSVGNQLVDKFLTLTITQYFLLGQWAAGKFKTGAFEKFRLHPLDQASLGNCVGSPMCPGIEVTWSLRNPKVYSQPLRIAHRDADYHNTGLSPSRDETEGGGCEPGDLTKRMAIPWQADFFQCTAQFVNFTDDKVNKANGIPKPPTYYAYWWPPQSPMFVLSGITDEAGPALSGVPSGFQVSYPRGINTFSEMILAWWYLGFVHNRNSLPERNEYPYFEEVERNHAAFVASSVAVGSVENFVGSRDQEFPWFSRASLAVLFSRKAVARTTVLAA